jgi:hypothetical protein
MATPSCCGGPSTGARTWTHATGCAPGNASGENAPARIAHGAGGFGAGVAYVRWSRAGEQSKSHPPRPPPNPETLDARMRHALARGWNTHANPRRPPQRYTRVHHMRSSGPLSNPAHRLARGRSGHFGGFHGPLTLWGCGGCFLQCGMTGLIIAADAGHSEVVECLLEHRADVNYLWVRSPPDTHHAPRRSYRYSTRVRTPRGCGKRECKGHRMAAGGWRLSCGGAAVGSLVD